MKGRIFSCFLMTFVSNGLARFGYVVLIPILILQGSLSQNESFALGIAILAGYIFGSLFINILQRYFSLESIARFSLFIIALSFVFCAFSSLPFIVAWMWRFLAGGASASLMILAAPLILPFINLKHRGKVGGIVFSGIGLGAVASGFILPFLAHFNLYFAWIFLASLSFFAFIFSCFFLKTRKMNQSKKQQTITKQPQFRPHFFLWLLVISYVLNAIGYLPHTLFWTDYLMRDIGFSSFTAGSSWAFFGIGAALRSLGSGLLSDKIGLKNAQIIILVFKSFSCFLAILSSNLWLLNVSVFLMGFTTTGNVTLTNSLALQIMGKAYFAKSSSLLTLAFGIFQAIFSFVFVYSLNFLGYVWLFILCGVALALSALVLLPIKNVK